MDKKTVMKLYFFLFIILSNNSIIAQNELDSLDYYSNKGDYKKALKYTEKFNLKKTDLNYVELITWKAELYDNLNDNTEAGKYYKIIENKLDSLDASFSLKKFYRYHIGKNYYYTNKFSDSKHNFIIYEKECSNKVNYYPYINTLEYLALINKNEENIKKADSLFKVVLNLKENFEGKNNEYYSKSLLHYAMLKDEENNFKVSDSLFKEVIKINNYIGNKDLKPLFIQAIFFIKYRLFVDAEINLLTVLKKSKELNLKDQLYWKVIIELVSLYNSTGNFNFAERIIDSVDYKIIEDINLKLKYLDVIAILYKNQNNFEKYSNAVYASTDLRVDNYDTNDPEIAKALNNLAFVCLDYGDYEKALNYLLKALVIHTNKNGFNNEPSAAYYYNIGTVCYELKDYKNAELYYKTAMKIRENVLGAFHEDFITTVNALACLYFVIEKYKDALDLMDKNIDNLNLNLFSENDPKYVTTLVNYGLIYLANNKFYETSLKYIKSLKISKNQLLNQLAFMSQSEIYQYNDNEIYKIFPLSFLNLFPNQYPEINIGCFENQLLLKNLSLRNQERIKTSIEKSSNATVKEKYQHFIENKRYLTKLAEIAISERPKNYELIKTDTENLEKELTRLSSTFADAKKSLAVNWKQIQEKLKPNEIAIDLVDYTYYNKKWNDSIYYGAFIIKKDSKFPQYITLFEKKQLEFLLSENINQQDSIKTNKHYSDKAISDLFLKPLQNELKGVSGIYLSPSGLGHQINFSALPVTETQTLGDKYKVHILGSTAEMVTYREANVNKKTNTELVLYGNIDYNKSDATNRIVSDVLATKNIAFTALFTRSTTTEKYGYLEGSKTEINKINTSAQQNNFATTIVEDRKATEESIKAFDGRTTPFVLHLATHGFFFPDIAKEIPNEIISPETAKKTYYKIAEDPMLRSGLILAGANKNLKKLSESDTIEDGILTASEISNLDLSACQLVVLSACETGLGQINGSEGVFGLQRAFKMAGVKNIIMSLWKVPDAQTAELFDIFYTECFAGKTIHEAFQTAQAKMKVKYLPYYWAGFVLLE